MRKNKTKSLAALLLLSAMLFAALLGVLTLRDVRQSRAESGVAELVRSELELGLGMDDYLTVKFKGESLPLSFESKNDSVATVNERGKVTAVGVGDTYITVSCDGFEDDVHIIVVEKKKGFDDNILMSVFWPPTAEYMNSGEGDELWDEQFQLLKDADIDFLNNVTGRDRKTNIDPDLVNENSKETNLKMAAYAYKYGMRYSVADTRFGANLTGMSKQQITDLIGEYRNVPGVAGYYILDEPWDTTMYMSVYSDMKDADPNGYMHLNFLPMWAYGNPAGTMTGAEETFTDVAERWLAYCADSGYPQDYLMYDYYPYDFYSGMNREVYFANLDVVRKIGLKYNVKTANYLQSVSNTTSSRSPSPSEIRYEAMSTLAYGFKQLSYFTWFTPSNREVNENYDLGIVGVDGKPNPVSYPAVSQLNREIHALGKTLINLDARAVYFSGFTNPRQVWGGQEMLPESFCVHSVENESFLVSLMKHKQTGQNYLMFVNNHYNKGISFNVQFDPEITSLSVVSKQDGSLGEVKLGDNNTLTIDLDAGDGVLYALPIGLDYTGDPAEEVDKTAANAVLERYENEKATFGDKDTSALEAAVAKLKDALGGTPTQQALDTLTADVERELDALASSEEKPGDDKPEEKPDGNAGGCGGCGTLGSPTGGGFGGGMLALSLIGAALFFVLRRKRSE